MSGLQAKINPQAVSTPFAVALIIAKNDEFNRSIMKYLWQNGVEALLTSSLTEGQAMIVQHLPDFVFLPTTIAITNKWHPLPKNLVVLKQLTL